MIDRAIGLETIVVFLGAARPIIGPFEAPPAPPKKSISSIFLADTKRQLLAMVYVHLECIKTSERRQWRRWLFLLLPPWLLGNGLRHHIYVIRNLKSLLLEPKVRLDNCLSLAHLQAMSSVITAAMGAIGLNGHLNGSNHSHETYVPLTFLP